MTFEEILVALKASADRKNVAGMNRFGINTSHALGVSMVDIRSLAKNIQRDHSLAQQLWSTKIHEAQILASLIADPKRVTKKEMEEWINDFDSWDVCDQVCLNLFHATPFARQKAAEWAHRSPEFVRRAGFSLMAVLAVHDIDAGDGVFTKYFSLIKKYASDERNFVRKAVNWALRQIGKRNSNLNRAAVQTAKEIASIDSNTARWIAADALRELTSAAIQQKLKRKDMV